MPLRIWNTSQSYNTAHCGCLCPRRTALVAILAPVAVCSAQAAPLVKGSLQDRIDQSKDGDQLPISGRYEEQLVISKPITLSSNPDDPAVLQWQTSQPYQSTITVVPGGYLRLSNVTIRHSSPSVANNYALFVQGGSAEMTGCDISSNTGSGIGIEGGKVTLSSSRIHDCQGNGAVVAGAIDVSGGTDATEDAMADQSEAQFVSCEISGNGGSGLIALDGSVVELRECTVSKNKRAGLELRVLSFPKVASCVLARYTQGPGHLQSGRQIGATYHGDCLYVDRPPQLQNVQDCEASLDGCVITQNRQASILQKRNASVQMLQHSGKNVVQPKPEFYR